MKENCSVICKYEEMTIKIYEYLFNTDITDIETMKQEIFNMLYLPSLEDLLKGNKEDV